jgi:hypothetical protein
MRGRAFGTITLVAGLVMALATPAGATQIGDPNDVAGKLDLKTLIGTKAGASAPLHITIVTYGDWRKRLLRESAHNRIFVLFNTDSDTSPEFVGTISESGGALHMVITGSGSSFEPLPVHHPNGHTITTVVPGSSPPNPDGNVRIAARSRFRNQTTCSTVCKDRIPNGGWLTIPA